jgi:hypothetical protein
LVEPTSEVPNSPQLSSGRLSECDGVVNPLVGSVFGRWFGRLREKHVERNTSSGDGSRVM